MTDKKKLIIALSLFAAVLLAAAFLPLAFKNRGEENTEGPELGSRAALFAEYWGGSSDIEINAVQQPTKAQVSFCAQRLEALIELCSLDKNIKEQDAAGSEYLIISNEDCRIELCRMWVQYQGDWQSWLDVCFDMNTGEIYYLYISSECLFNGDDYENAIEGGVDAKKIAKLIAEKIGYDLRYLAWSGESSETATAVYVSEGNAVCIDINCIYYESRLLDVKFCCA